MSVGWTCPSLRSKDPVAIQNGEKASPCPGHDGECRIQHTPRRPLADVTTEQLEAMLARHLEAQDA